MPKEDTKKKGKKMFEEELEFFKENQTELVEKFDGKFLVIKGNEVLGAYETPIDALNEGIKKAELGSFMIQPCEPGPGAYTVMIGAI